MYTFNQEFFTNGRNMSAYLKHSNLGFWYTNQNKDVFFRFLYFILTIDSNSLTTTMFVTYYKIIYNNVDNNNIISCDQQKSHDQRSVSPYLYWLNGSKKVPRYPCFRQDTYYL